VTPAAVLLDVDGTLVDSNDAHAKAWVKAFAEAGVAVEYDRVRRCIGMGADKLMPAVSGITEDSPTGDRISDRRREIFSSEFLPHLQRFRDADRLVSALSARGLTLVAASSAKTDELRLLLEIAGAASLLDATTSSDEADQSKPDPDIVVAALRRAKTKAHHTVMIGDTPYDVEAAARAGVRTVAFRCGGWGDEDLRGAVAVYDGPWDLLARLDESPFART
jgi:HAD superfamily hydrolase (TIGR01509 family)